MATPGETPSVVNKALGHPTSDAQNVEGQNVHSDTNFGAVHSNGTNLGAPGVAPYEIANTAGPNTLGPNTGSKMGDAEAADHGAAKPNLMDKAEGAVHKMEHKTGTQNTPTDPATGTATGVGGGLGTAEAISHGSAKPSIKDKAMGLVHKVEDKVTGKHAN